MVLCSWLILTIEQTIVHVTYTMKWRWHVLERTTIRLRINNQFRSTRSIHLEIVLNVGYLYLIICKDVLRHWDMYLDICNLMKWMRNSILLWTIAKWFGGLSMLFWECNFCFKKWAKPMEKNCNEIKCQ